MGIIVTETTHLFGVERKESASLSVCDSLSAGTLWGSCIPQL